MELTPWEELIILHLRQSNFDRARREIAVFEEEERMKTKQDDNVLFCTDCGGYKMHSNGEQQIYCDDCMED